MNICNLAFASSFYFYFYIFSGLLSDMATSHEIVDATAREGLSKFPVLPPIRGAQQWVDVDQIAAAKDEIMRTLRASKTATIRLRHRRSRAQQEQRHMVLYVVLSAKLSPQSLNDDATTDDPSIWL